MFDASAIVNLLLTQGSSALDSAKGNDVLDLTLYEVGNALWKLSTLRGKISAAEADSLQSVLVRTATSHMNLVRVSEVDHISVSRLARTEKISYYDASYISAAVEKKREIITDDARLAKIASKFVSVKGSSELSGITSGRGPIESREPNDDEISDVVQKHRHGKE